MTRGTVGTEDQKKSEFRGSLGVEERENTGEHGKKGSERSPDY